MSTTFAFLALSGFLTAASNSAELAFQTKYVEARQLAKDQGKPLAVFVGSGENGWEKVCSDGKANDDVKKLLGENYVCVYIDRADENGKRLAADFEIANGNGLIISNRAGSLQAFRHSGDVSNETLTKQLQRYADTNLVVQQTERLATTHTSHYPPSGGGAPAHGHCASTGCHIQQGGCVPCSPHATYSKRSSCSSCYSYSSYSSCSHHSRGCGHSRRGGGRCGGGCR